MPRSSLTRYAPMMRDPDPQGERRAAAQYWHERGAVVILPDMLKQMEGLERTLIEAIATKHYGKRKG